MARRYGCRSDNGGGGDVAITADIAEVNQYGADLPQLAVPGYEGPPQPGGAFDVQPPAPGGIDPVVWQAMIAFARQVSIRSSSFQLPDFFPIPGAIEFQLFGTLNVSANLGPQQIPFQNLQGGAASLQLPPGNVARIATVNIFIEGVVLSPTTNQTFSILQNGSPIPGWTNRTTFGRTATSIERAFDAFIRTDPAVNISATVVDNDGGSYNVGVDITGWYYATAAAEKYLAQGGQR